MKNFFRRYALKGFFGGGSGTSDPNDQTYILVDEKGNEVTAVLVEDVTMFDATANDIRVGKVAATESGVTVGTKNIPSYLTSVGIAVIPKGSVFAINDIDDCEYTELQAVVCSFEGSLAGSVAVSKIVIENNVYEPNSTEVLASITIDVESSAINFGITNESDAPCVIRYFSYREEN